MTESICSINFNQDIIKNWDLSTAQPLCRGSVLVYAQCVDNSTEDFNSFLCVNHAVRLNLNHIALMIFVKIFCR